jgi:multisubunit Na+/H+ antiporter MnhG subunit
MSKPSLEVFRQKITRDQCKDTGMALVLILLLIYFFKHREGLVVAAAIVLVINMAAPQLYRPAAIVWFGFSHVLGSVMSRVILGLVFLVVVTPMALIRRLAGKDSLSLRLFKSGDGSVLLERNHTFVAKDLEKPY